jgi:Na+/melibiose symporter-like transporter
MPPDAAPELSPTEPTVATPIDRHHVRRLLALFGCIYFAQGICEPTEGLLSQPIKSLLKSWDWQPAQIATFIGLLSAPWCFKPLFGAISDHVPIFGYRRKVYLVAAAALSAVGFFAADALVAEPSHAKALFALLLASSIGVAFGDVVIDALMVETAQPRGLTGRFQGVQWSAIYAAGILEKIIGGYLSQTHQERWGLVIGGGLSLGVFLLCLWAAPERPNRDAAISDPRGALRSFWSAITTPGVRPVGVFLFLWAFNPFSSTVLYVYLTESLGLEESLYGYAESAGSAAAMCGCVAYTFYCRRIAMRRLIHWAIALGALSSLAYLLVEGPRSAIVIAMLNGWMTATATMIQLDLAARICPLSSAGAVFATLMALSTLGNSLSTIVGGYLYGDWRACWGSEPAFDLLVVVGAASTALCWLLMPWLRRSYISS